MFSILVKHCFGTQGEVWATEKGTWWPQPVSDVKNR